MCPYPLDNKLVKTGVLLYIDRGGDSLINYDGNVTPVGWVYGPS